MCHLQPTIQPLWDYAEAYARPRVLLSLCSYNLRGASAQVRNLFASQDSKYTEPEALRNYWEGPADHPVQQLRKLAYMLAKILDSVAVS